MLDDRDMMADFLMMQKFLCQSYSAAASQAAGEQLRGDLIDLLREEHMLEASACEHMNRRGWYQPRPASQADLSRARSRYGRDRQPTSQQHLNT